MMAEIRLAALPLIIAFTSKAQKEKLIYHYMEHFQEYTIPTGIHLALPYTENSNREACSSFHDSNTTANHSGAREILSYVRVSVDFT